MGMQGEEVRQEEDEVGGQGEDVRQEEERRHRGQGGRERMGRYGEDRR